MSERIGFLGLGIMGSRMAANVARAGFPLTVWTHTPGKAERWASEHDAARLPPPPPRWPGQSDIVVSMVVDGEQVARGPARARTGVIEGAHARDCCAWTARRSPPPRPAASARRWPSATCACSTPR